MTTYDGLAQAAAALADPATSPLDLMDIAQAYPVLWVDVAKHPNAYPDLLSWLQSVGNSTVREAIAAREQSPQFPTPPVSTEDEQPVQSDTNADSPITSTDADVPSIPDNPTPVDETSPKKKPSWVSTPKGKKILIGSGSGLLAVILAIILIVNLVVIPHQRAEEAEVAEQARLEQEHQTAVDVFTKAADACTQANKTLATSISHAQQTATLDPSTLLDPALIDALNQAISTAQAVKNCVPPTMADDTATIRKQAADMAADTSTVTTANSALTNADQSASKSYQTKANQEAAAKASANATQKAEQQATSQATSTASQGGASTSHTLTSSTTTSDGYSYTTTVTLTNWFKVTDTAGTTSAWNSVGGKGSWSLPADSSGIISGDYGFAIGTFGTDKSAVIFGKMTVTNTTSGFALPPSKATPSLTIDPSDAHDELYKRTASKDMAFCLQFSSLKCNEAWGYPSWQMDSGKSQYVSFYIVDGLAFSPTDPTGQGTVSQTLQLGSDAKTTLPGNW